MTLVCETLLALNFMSLSRKSLLVGAIFFVVAFLTLSHYGTNWDTINHLPRGQAYLRYFLTGKRDYVELEKYQSYWQDPTKLLVDSKASDRSFYQMDDATVDFYISVDGDGHPPISDILSAASNRIWFGQFHLLNDIDAYRVYGIFLAACLVGLVYYWMGKTYGSVAALVAAFSLAIYPLFWSESHFNTEKDIPQTVYWSFLLFCVWKGVLEKSTKWLLFSGVFFGLALGTKFNIVFVVPVIGLWILFLLLFRYLKFSHLLKTIVVGLIAIIIGLAIFIGSWPYLWLDPIGGISRVLTYYQNIGTGGQLGIGTLPLLWILYTTPLSILFLCVFGLIYVLYLVIWKKDRTALLILLWFLMPIIRVSWPGSSSYGGLRQLMEYIPALAMISGLGANLLYDEFKFKRTGLILLLILFIPITFKLISIHPNENVYFNPLIGGLAGAKAANFPFWGFSFGSPYRQGFEWLNMHAEKDAKVAFAYELLPNFPAPWVRSDLQLYNAARSGYLRQGEYAITLNYQGIENRSYYEMYLDKFIEPIYQIKVDGVSILTIWKNNNAHLKLKLEEDLVPNVKLIHTSQELVFDLGEAKSLSRLEINYAQNNCQPLKTGVVKISEDGVNWQLLPGILPNDWRIAVLGEQPKKGEFIEPFVGQIARYINLSLTPKDTCLKNIQNFKAYYFR